MSFYSYRRWRRTTYKAGIENWILTLMSVTQSCQYFSFTRQLGYYVRYVFGWYITIFVMFNVSETTLLSHCVIINAAYRRIDIAPAGTHVAHMYNKWFMKNRWSQTNVKFPIVSHRLTSHIAVYLCEIGVWIENFIQHDVYWNNDVSEAARGWIDWIVQIIFAYLWMRITFRRTCKA